MADSARTLVVRVWLPDRPGALGQVASRIGALHGDVTAIDILERGAGRVVDELVVSLPRSASDELLARELRAVDGVDVEHIRTGRHERPDSATAVLELAARVAVEPPHERLPLLCDGLLVALDADWAVVVADGERGLLHRRGDPPELAWLRAFLDGSDHLDASTHAAAAPGDVVWARLRHHGATFAAGRLDRSIHGLERSRVGALATIVDALAATGRA